ncbi:NAD(P)-binding protein [Sorangium cellulosum]|uniref:NAD(P)-binding protein n=1 Tax=Sorangium cellulosum TaxID=56 RepID=UPI003D9A9BE0
MDPEKTKVAVVGGGVSALTAVYALTSTPELRARYDVTVYQFGHRLGGKGASGRNLGEGNGKRIEEHGLHLWFGFYENAFKWMRACYKELGRTEGPIKTWQEAFHPHRHVVLMRTMNGDADPWTIVFPPNKYEPGDGTRPPSLLLYLELIFKLMFRMLGHDVDDDTPQCKPLDSPVPEYVRKSYARAIERGAVPRSERAPWHGTVIQSVPTPPEHELGPGTASIVAPIESAFKILASLGEDPMTHEAHDIAAITWLVNDAVKRAQHLSTRSEGDRWADHLRIALDLFASCVTGMFKDGVLFDGFDGIDRWDFREWLKKNGASDATLSSTPVHGFYDVIFGFVKGGTGQPSVGAGTALRTVLRLLAYKGSFMYRMNAGMGDIVMAPFYQVLKKRGIAFKFFHRVKELAVEGNKVTRITVTKQVKLKDESKEYDPLIYVGGLPCWPSTPLYDQIEGGDTIIKNPLINFESSWSAPWADQTEEVLQVGKDFDQVILAASIAALPHIAEPMLRANPLLQQSVDKVLTCQTQALQLWLSKTASELGWQQSKDINEKAAVCAYSEPINTWADMSDLVQREEWTLSEKPESIAYFCGPWGDAQPIPDFSNHHFPAQELARYHQQVEQFLSADVKGLWPNYVSDDRLSLYARVNIEPTERYVLSVPNSVEYRLRADQSGFDNVVLCGDWTRNGLNLGCVEAAVMSGLWASNALCGVPESSEIVGSDG